MTIGDGAKQVKSAQLKGHRDKGTEAQRDKGKGLMVFLLCAFEPLSLCPFLCAYVPLPLIRFC